MSTTLQQVGDLSPLQKRALLSKLLQKRVNEATSDHPLSYNQQGIWFLYQLAPESSVYNVNFAARITADLDAPALQRAFQDLIDRHSSLRTTFPVQFGKPVQRIYDSRKVHFQEVECRSWPLEQLQHQLMEEAYRPFDLERGPLLRVSLFTRSEREHVLLLVVHHIVIDFWSLAILLDELGTLYPAESAGVKPPLRHHGADYADYVRWQAEMLEGPEGEQLWAYWRKQLGGRLPVLQLRTDRLRPAIPTYRGGSNDFTINAELSYGLKELARAHGATPYTTLLTAFQILLSYHSGQDDILVGSPMVGRSRPEFEGIIGLFTNPVVLRADLSGNPTFREFLGQVRRTVLDALEHQDFPTVLLVERLRPPRDFSRPPLCQAMFVLDKPHNGAQSGAPKFAAGESGLRMDSGGLVLDSVRLERRAATLDLVMLILETQDSLEVSLRYNIDLFDPATIARMSLNYELLLRRILQEPTVKIDTLKQTLANMESLRQAHVRKEQKKANSQRLNHFRRRAALTGANE